MSIFDEQEINSQRKNNKKKIFFEKVTGSKEIILKRKPFYEMQIIFQKKNGVISKSLIQIIEHYLILFKVIN